MQPYNVIHTPEKNMVELQKHKVRGYPIMQEHIESSVMVTQGSQRGLIQIKTKIYHIHNFVNHQVIKDVPTENLVPAQRPFCHRQNRSKQYVQSQF
ncbi:hypothetical protein GDO78_003657 [Eleutherodactylus coqui]|uniref:Uncharacterized protein n=1 Tax=Eleutherodactylus coqui TaxID=57060 RepID=A0A8J6K0Y8_ELECQ|nr:hypothetical protein GDO78_003657 [Eleutherodactylus coqui]